MKPTKTRLPLAQESDRNRILQRAQERVEAQRQPQLENTSCKEQASVAPARAEKAEPSQLPKAA